LIANISVFLVVFSTYIINKSYVFLFFGSLLVFALSRTRRVVFIDFYSLSMLFFSLALIVFWARELLFGGLEETDYFISSFMVAFSYFLILVSVRFEVKDFSNILKLLWVSLLVQSIIILLRFFGLFEVPVPFGISDVNRGVVSLQVREQVTSASLALQGISMLMLARSGRDKCVSFIVTMLAFPAVLIAGSMLAFIVFSVIIAIFSFDFLKRSRFAIKAIFISIVLICIFSVLPFFSGVVMEHYETAGVELDQSVDLIRKVGEGDTFIDKLLNRNTRILHLTQSVTLSLKDAPSFMFGNTKKEFMDYSGGFSPHSIISEIIALSGVVGFFVFLFFSWVLFLKSRRMISAQRFVAYYFLFLLAGTINSVNMGLPIIGLMVVLFGYPKYKYGSWC